MPLSYAKNKVHIMNYRKNHPEAVEKSNARQREKRLFKRQEEENERAFLEGREPVIVDIPGQGRPNVEWTKGQQERERRLFKRQEEENERAFLEGREPILVEVRGVGRPKKNETKLKELEKTKLNI